MEIIDISTIVNIILGILSAIFGGKWILGKKLLKEISKALAVTSNAIADNTITRKELQDMQDKWNDVIETAKKLTGS